MASARKRAITALKSAGFGGVAAATALEALCSRPELLGDLALEAEAFVEADVWVQAGDGHVTVHSGEEPQPHGATPLFRRGGGT